MAGNLDEPIWLQAGVAVNFTETSPGDQIQPPVESRALIAYDVILMGTHVPRNQLENLPSQFAGCA